jgi:hypothetical protein
VSHVNHHHFIITSSINQKTAAKKAKLYEAASERSSLN